MNKSIGKGIFIDKMFDRQDAFNFQNVRMSSITSNRPSSIFYSSTMSAFVKIARSTLINTYLPVAKHLLDLMIGQGGFKRIF